MPNDSLSAASQKGLPRQAVRDRVYGNHHAYRPGHGDTGRNARGCRDQESLQHQLGRLRFQHPGLSGHLLLGGAEDAGDHPLSEGRRLRPGGRAQREVQPHDPGPRDDGPRPARRREGLEPPTERSPLCAGNSENPS